MLAEQKRLIDKVDLLKRKALSGFDGFIVRSGAVRHRPTDRKSRGLKTTFRAANFFSDYPPPEKTISARRVKRVINFACNQNLATLISNEDIGLLDRIWGLLLWPLDPSSGAALRELEKCITQIKKIDYLREHSGETVPSPDEPSERDWPHTVFFHVLDAVLCRFESAELVLKIHDLKEFRSSIIGRCAEELYKQCSLYDAEATEHFDVAKLAFSIKPTIKLIPVNVAEHAIQICAESLVAAPNQAFLPYRISSRDRHFRPILEEVVSALLDGARKLLLLKRTQLACSDKVYRLIELVSERARIRHRDHPDKITRAHGWAGVDWPHPPEAWPTLATAEMLTKSDEFLRLSLLYDLQAQYEFQIVSADLPVKVAWPKYQILPFGVYKAIQDHMLLDEPRWASAVLFGPPGTGKTSFVQAIAKEKSWDLVKITPADVAQEGPYQVIARARILLEGLSYVERIVILLDEFDPFIVSREITEQGTWRHMITNAMLPLLEGLSTEKRSLLFLATNYVKSLDKAGLREGRFDAKLPIWPPDEKGRATLIRDYYVEHKNRIKESTIRKRARKTKWCTVGELLKMCRGDVDWRDGDTLSKQYICQLEEAVPNASFHDYN